MWVGCIAGALNPEEYRQILRKVGFKDIEITPAIVYTKEIIKSMAEQENPVDAHGGIDTELLDSAFAGTRVRAYKG